jgi:hypothetical protein
MTINEQTRHAMYVQLESVLGQEAALILMEHLPPVGWADVATKRDLDHLHLATRHEVQQLGTELRGEIQQLGTELRGEIQQLGTELRGEIQQLGTELRGEMQQLATRTEMQQLGTDLRGEMSQLSERMFDRMTAQTRTLVFTVLGSCGAVAAVALSAARLG